MWTHIWLPDFRSEWRICIYHKNWQWRIYFLGYSGSDTTYFVNFDQKYKTGLGRFILDVRIRSSTSTKQVENKLLNIEICTNHSHDRITIRSVDLNKFIEMEIVSIDGKMAYHDLIDFSSGEMNFQWPVELESGIYFFKFSSKKGSQVIKAIKL